MILAKDFYLIRTPLLPLNLLEQFNELPHAGLNKRLKTIFAQPYLQEAIYIASPELFQEFQKWLQGYLLDEKEVDKLVISIYKYLLRMCSRCTPYGLFAGCAVGEFGEISRVRLAHPDQHKKHCRLDMNYVAELAAMINGLPEVQSQLCFHPNNSLYKIGNKCRYAEFKIENKFRTYHLTEIACSDYLEKILKTASHGATLTALTKTIVSNDITEEEAKAFVMELIQNQVLVSELEPTITGEEFFNKLIKKLQCLDNTAGLTGKLIHIRRLLQDQTTGIDKYLQANLLVKELLPGTNSRDLVQTDLFLGTEQNTISSTVIAGIEKQVEKLWSLARLATNSDLNNFMDRFSERYEEQEIPLLIALDAEAGIGYAGYSGTNTDYTPLVDDIFTGKKNESITITRNKMDEFQLKKLHACLRDNAGEIELTDKDLDELKDTATPSIPGSFYVMGSILGESASEIDAGNYQFELSACGGPSAGNLLGRFCHGNDSLTAKLKSCLREEEENDPGNIYAEVVHLPEARTGNVLLRPQLRDYEIVYLGNGSVAPDHQIPLTDLMVSIQNNNIVLRSKKLNKRIIPRLSTAHNFSTGSLPVYKFLCDLQFQQLHSGIAWRWNIINDAPFLPGVRYGKIILSKRTWVLHKKDYAELNQKKESDGANYTELFERARKQLQLPKYVVIVEGDNELLINLENESCLYILANTLIKNDRVVLEEFLKTGDKCFVEGEQGRYTNEIIIPLKKVDTIKQQLNSIDAPGRQPTIKDECFNQNHIVPERSFITGSEWLYVKIYCGTNSAERLLKEVIKPLTECLILENNIDKWFFIRYADPGSHIRLRFHHAKDKGFWKLVLERIHAAMRDDAYNTLAYKIQTDTYEREIERYGINTIELTEDIFYYDSEAVINCIDLLEGEEGEKYRWLLAARGIDMLLEDFSYHLTAKAALLKKLQQGFFSEFGGDKTLNNQLNDKYRGHMQSVNRFLDPGKDIENEIEEAVGIFSIRSLKLKKAVEKIRIIQARETATPGFDELLRSYIHIFLNRMFLSNQRKHELVIYHFLNKYYESQIAITRKQLQKV
ncbi:MAG: lantibiotic dehydratase [Ferruginibacter sp.]